MDLHALKVELRQRLGEEDRRHTPDERAQASRELCRRVEERPVWQHAHAVMLFASMTGEPDVWPLIHRALAAGKNVILPRFVARDRIYEACRIADLQADLRSGHFGILEPQPACPVFALNRLDLVLVPGVGFTRSGWRLGRGKGYYDRLLASVRGLKCGIAFDWQVVGELPAEPHDIRLNCILTPTCWHDCAGASVLK